MADFQEQLRQYRQQKQRRETLDIIKIRLRKFWMLGTGAETSQGKCYTTIDVKPAKESSSDAFATSEPGEDFEYVASSEDDELMPQVTVNADVREESKCFKYTLWGVYFLFWVTLYVIAIELKFGLVFLMFSALFFIYFNTRTGPKKSNELSAYSVFNKNCESIDGTLKAEQFENEIRYGSASVR
ncbi:SAYSvFN domain-containing protein 1 [Drosophila innubila]|uniref:SAYSvFN domain-containing protein 1 n=1 Tax=Drosophila innubila TaxID=198719 RepID=UPI00148DC893|nr:SAYSvFN domain-containing protein 1 [Drosophila innubila]